jgi:hypothetical protein
MNRRLTPTLSLSLSNNLHAAGSRLAQASAAPKNGRPGSPLSQKRFLRLLLASSSPVAAAAAAMGGGWGLDPVQPADPRGQVVTGDAAFSTWTKMAPSEIAAESAKAQVLADQQDQQRKQQIATADAAIRAVGSSSLLRFNADEAAKPMTRGVISDHPSLQGPIRKPVTSADSLGPTSADFKAAPPPILDAGSSAGAGMLLVDQPGERRPWKPDADDDSSRPLPDVLKPGDNDVLLGRGGEYGGVVAPARVRECVRSFWWAMSTTASSSHVVCLFPHPVCLHSQELQAPGEPGAARIGRHHPQTFQVCESARPQVLRSQGGSSHST